MHSQLLALDEGDWSTSHSGHFTPREDVPLPTGQGLNNPATIAQSV
jgi:hypothetical protein